MDRTPITPRVSAQDRVRAALAAFGLGEVPIKAFSESTATAVEAAAAIGTSVERIVKSLVFAAGEQPVLVLASGPNRVDVTRVGQLVGAPLRRASADQVRAWTGFAIGGVPPVGHTPPLLTFLDEDLMQYDQVWAAAGTPNAVFAIAPAELARITQAMVVEVAERA
jgi:prolyl-tRNA editing enzyme YbaK/EbsC (Cys-tRNA(Pro) deacylase)